MASAWSKFLRPVTVPTGGWAFVYNDGGAQTATVAAGTYDTVLHLCSELHDKIEVESGPNTAVISVSQLAIVSITITSLASVTWGSCAADLLTVLGFAGSESVAASAVTATSQHTHGWYPGLISLPGKGVGLEDDSDSIPEGDIARSTSGSGKRRSVGPARRIYTRTLRFAAIKRTEFRDKLRGPITMQDRGAHAVWYWYFDRTDGDVASYGTQVDPGYNNYEADSDGNYLKITMNGDLLVTRATSTPRWQTVQLTFNVEPK